MWFIKGDKTPTPMTGDIIEWDAIVELQYPDDSRSVT